MNRHIQITEINGRRSETVTQFDDIQGHSVVFSHGNTTLDMLDRAQARINELEDALKDLLFWNEQPCHNEDDAAGLVGSVYAAMDSARAILNKK